MSRPTLNADVGELPERAASGDEDALIALLDEANIACGGHAGDDDSMQACVRSCLAHGVSVGAHPSYPDRANFGRTSVSMTSSSLGDSVRAQLQALQRIAVGAGARVAFVKPHGALYHDVGRDPGLASVFRAAVADVLGDDVPLVLFWRATTTTALVRGGASIRREGFADRGTDVDGDLLPRGRPGAVLSPDEAVAQLPRVLAMAGAVDTICVHGDGPEALAVARAVSAALRAHSGA